MRRGEPRGVEATVAAEVGEASGEDAKVRGAERAPVGTADRGGRRGEIVARAAGEDEVAGDGGIGRDLLREGLQAGTRVSLGRVQKTQCENALRGYGVLRALTIEDRPGSDDDGNGERRVRDEVFAGGGAAVSWATRSG